MAVVAEYKLTLIIDSAITKLKSSDNLCIAKKVDGKFTSIFADGSVNPKDSSQKQLVYSNEFKWKDEYRVYVTKTYEHGILAKSESEHMEIKFGEQSIFDGTQFATAVAAPLSDFRNEKGFQSREDSFSVKKVTNKFHFAVESKVVESKDVEGKVEVTEKWGTIYVDPDTHVGEMDKTLTPLNEYLIFWNSAVKTDYMIDESKFSHPFNFKFEDGKKDITIRFGFAKENKPVGTESATFYRA